MTYSLELKNVSKTFSTVQALSRFNLTCNEGEIIVLLGENGAGKSTIVSLLSGFITPDTGDMYVYGKKVFLNTPQKSFQEKIGIVFQHSSLVAEFTVLENLLLSKNWYEKCSFDSTLKKFQEIAQFLGIDINPLVLVKNLSLGEQQLIELIRALYLGQKILLFDELTAHLTKHEVTKLGKAMNLLAKQGCTILFITHKLEEAMSFADKIIVLQKGKKTLEITKKEIITYLHDTESKNTLENLLYSNMFSQFQNLNSSPKRPYVSYEKKPIFRAQSLNTHPEKGELVALKNISFDIYQSEIIGIAGFDGQGQKNLAELLAGQKKCKQGQLFLDTNNISHTNLRKRQELGIFYVSDDRLHEGIAAEETIDINLQLKNTKDKNFFKYLHILWKNVRKYGKLSMEELSISKEHAKNPIHCLSGGNIQKVIVKRELNQKNVRLLILHQPSYGIDFKTKAQLHATFLEEAEKGCAFILLSSDIEELLFLSHRLAIIQNGQITEFFPNDSNAHEKITKGLTRHQINIQALAQAQEIA